MSACRMFVSLLLGCVASAAAQSQSDTRVKQLYVKPLEEYPAKEGVILEVSYPPGGADQIHRHDAHAFIYVLEGTIRMQLQGQPETLVKAGQVFYEGPNDVHLIGRNASATKPARFVVVLIKNRGAPVLTPVALQPSSTTQQP